MLITTPQQRRCDASATLQKRCRSVFFLAFEALQVRCRSVVKALQKRSRSDVEALQKLCLFEAFEALQKRCKSVLKALQRRCRSVAYFPTVLQKFCRSVVEALFFSIQRFYNASAASQGVAMRCSSVFRRSFGVVSALQRRFQTLYVVRQLLFLAYTWILGKFIIKE